MFATIRRAGMAGLVLAGALLCAAPVSSATTPAVHTGPEPTGMTATSGRPMTTAASADKGCIRQWWFTGDGVRIHSRPSLHAPAVGLGYAIEFVDVLDARPGWLKISDNTGIITVGWVVREYLEPYDWCPAPIVPRAPHGVS